MFLADKNKDEAMNLYVKHTIDAIGHLLRTYMGLRLHNRLALQSKAHACPEEMSDSRLQSALKDQLFRPQLCLESFENSLKRLPPDLLDQQELGPCEVPRDIIDTIILAHMQNCKGLEQLMVICVGLDAPINLEADAIVATAHIYQALTRAQLHAIIVNEYVQNGWLEFLGMVKFTESRTFKESAALEETLAEHIPSSQVETTVVVMATSVWDTDDNDHRIEDFRPHQKQREQELSTKNHLH